MRKPSTPVADFYVGRGEKAEYIGSIVGANVNPEDLRAFTRFQGTEKNLYDERQFRAEVAHLIESPEYELAFDGTRWPYGYATSGASDWAYCFDLASVHVFQEGHLVFTILCNGARKEADFPWHGGLDKTSI